MQRSTLTNLPTNGISLLVEDEIGDDVKLNNLILRNCRFIRVGMRDAKVHNSAITQTAFEDCYMPKAEFIGVDLTGCLFRNCNLGKVKFQSCKLQFCRFESTLLNVEDVKSCLPAEPNIRLRLVRNLRMNFTSLGDSDAADIFLDLEIAARTDDLLGILRACVESGRGGVFFFRMLPEFDFSLGCNPSPAIPAV